MTVTNCAGGFITQASFQNLSIILVLFFTGLVFFMLFTPSKTKLYRRYISDMYVSGKIKQFAEKDKINLVEEAKSFKKWRKTSELYTKDLDNVVEEELKERIANNEKFDSSESKPKK